MFKGSRKMNAVEFILNGADLYDVNFLRCTTKGQTIVVQHTDLFFDQLKDVFEIELLERIGTFRPDYRKNLT